MEWGQRGGVSVAEILNQIKTSETVEVEEAGEKDEAGEGTKPLSQKIASPATSDSSLSPAPSLEGEVKAGSGEVQTSATATETDAPPAKRQKEMTLEEYEAMLDEDEAGGGFMDAADLYNIP